MRADRFLAGAWADRLQAAALALLLGFVAPQAAAQIAFRAATNTSVTSGTTITINVPAGTTLNDVLIASIAFRPCSSTDNANCTKSLTAPSGWTQVDAIDQKTGGGTGGYGMRLYVYRHVAGLVEPASYTWNFAGSPALTGAVGGMLGFSGVDTTSPIIANGTGTNGTSQNVSAPSVNAGGVSNAWLVTTHASLSSGTWTPPAGMTERVDKASLATPDDLGLSLNMNTLSLGATTGATGIKTATMSSPPVADAGAGESLILRPATSVSSTPGGFNAFETSTIAGAITGVIKTKIAGTAFSLAVIALNATRTAVLTTFTGTVTVELLNASDNTGALNATTQCRSTWTSVIATVSPSPTFASTDLGRATVSFPAVANAYRDVRVRVTYTSGGTTVIGCSTDDFAIRPSSFASLQATDGTDTTTGVARALNNSVTTSGVVHRAGRAFTLVGSAVSSTGVTTTGYDGTPTLGISSCTVPAGCAAGVLSSALTAASGTISGTATYSEAGVITAALSDASFAAVDAADSTAAEMTITSSALTIGRFVPEAYRLTTSTTPTLAPPLCGSGPASQSFVFVGQSFAFGTNPTVLATPINFGGTVLANARPRFGTSAVTATLSASGAPVTFSGSVSASSVTTSSTATIAFTGSSFSFTRGATPVASFTPTIAMAVDVSDTTETATAGNTAINDEATLTVSPVAFSPSASPFYYGRIQLTPTFGDYRRDLSVPLEVQAWNGLGWMPLTAAAACFSAGATTFAYSQPTGGLDNGGGAFNCATRVASTITTSNGRAGIALANPSYTSTTTPSAMTLTLNVLSVASGTSCSALNTLTTATTTGLTWLSWPNGSNPSARVTWGRARGDSMYLRERFD
jgi:MSHA biogenesis protein MshQ